MMLLSLVEAMSLFLVIAYAYCKSPLYRPLEVNAWDVKTHQRVNRSTLLLQRGVVASGAG